MQSLPVKSSLNEGKPLSNGEQTLFTRRLHTIQSNVQENEQNLGGINESCTTNTVLKCHSACLTAQELSKGASGTAHSSAKQNICPLQACSDITRIEGHRDLFPQVPSHGLQQLANGLAKKKTDERTPLLFQKLMKFEQLNFQNTYEEFKKNRMREYDVCGYKRNCSASLYWY